MNAPTPFVPFTTLGPSEPLHPVVLDSPHSGRQFPSDFGSHLDEATLRSGEDCYVDELVAPAAQEGVDLWLVAAQFPRTYIDPNRHPLDIDTSLLHEGEWPGPTQPSGLAATGKAVVWRTLDDGRDIYQRRLTVAEVQARIARCHQPFHHALGQRIAATHQRFGLSVQIDCHSMNEFGDLHTAGKPGEPRPDFVVGDLHGQSCGDDITQFLLEHLRGKGYWVTLNDPFAGLEMVRAHSAPHRGLHGLQLEINKRLYMNEQSLQKTENFGPLQADVLAMFQALNGFARSLMPRS